MTIRIHLRGELSDGQVSVIETEPDPGVGVGPPLHHHDFDEAFYLLEGRLTFRLRDEYVTAGPGELVFAPRGVPHTFANLSGAPARQLIVCTPPASSATSRGWQPSGRAPNHPSGPLGSIPEVVTVGPPIDPSARER